MFKKMYEKALKENRSKMVCSTEILLVPRKSKSED